MADDRSGSAFPFWQPFENGVECSDGLSRREWFAGMALIGVQASDKIVGQNRPEDIAKYVYRVADAMITEGGNKKP